MKVQFFACELWDGGFWFRIFGYGLHIKNIVKNPLLYSDKVNKRLRIGKWQIKILRYEK